MSETFTEQVEATELEARRAAIETIKPLYDLKTAKADYDRAMRMFDPSASDYGKMGALRRWLLDHDGERLDDGETGLSAWLASGGEQALYDTPLAIKERHPDLFQRLWELGALEVDGERVKDALKKGLLAEADAEKFSHHVMRTARLMIQETK